MKKHEKIDKILHQLNISPLKRYGQNFLVDEMVIAKILETARIEKNDRVMEIGPGLGAITEHLPLSAIQYTSYEIDQTFHRYLENTFPQGTHYRQNFLKASPQPVDIILGNLPYYATTEIIEKIFKDFPKFKRAILMVQKEVMPRLIAKPNDEPYGPLAIFLAAIGDIKPILDVNPESFYPEPKVTSTIFMIDTYTTGPKVETRPFFYFIKKLFLHRRKTILNNLLGVVSNRTQASAMLSQANIALNARPETLSLEQYLYLFALTNEKKSL